jgi:hypothetical protein
MGDPAQWNYERVKLLAGDMQSNQHLNSVTNFVDGWNRKKQVPLNRALSANTLHE